MKLELRDYQKEVLNIIDNLETGSYLIQMATGLGKTATFANIKRKGRVLVLAHREELVTQPVKYYDCPVGIEMANHISNNEPVIIASVQSLTRRLEKFKPNEFDMIITDEAHHAGAESYKKIYRYFKPRLHLGFTATPNRSDGVRLNDVFDKIIYEKDIKWAIQNKYLTNIECLRINIGYDLSKVAKRMGDFAVGELEQIMNTEVINKAIKEVYDNYAKGQTLIFGTTVKHCEDIAKEIPGAIAVTGNTKNREEIIKRFTNREIPVLVNCMVFTEGTDMPLIETIIMARPTQSNTLYTQMVGRGLRLYPGKDKLRLIDLVGTTSKANLCTAPSLIGIDMKGVPEKKQAEIQGDLFELPELIKQAVDCPDAWIKNVEYVNLWAKEQKYNMHNVNWFKMPNGELILNLKGKRLIIPAQNELGETCINGINIKMQEAFDKAYEYLEENYADQKYIWDLSIVKKWGRNPASDKQIQCVKRFFREMDCTELTKLEAMQILNRMYAKRS